MILYFPEKVLQGKEKKILSAREFFFTSWKFGEAPLRGSGTARKMALGEGKSDLGMYMPESALPSPWAISGPFTGKSGFRKSILGRPKAPIGDALRNVEENPASGRKFGNPVALLVKFRRSSWALV